MWKIILCSVLVMVQASVNACLVLDYSARSITDDVIAHAIRKPRPLSVSDVINLLMATPDLNTIESLNLSENTICLDGTIDLLNFIDGELKEGGKLQNLKHLDLSYNRIRDWRGHKENIAFEKVLKKLLSRQDFSINLSNNYLENDWAVYIRSKFSKGNLFTKIII